MLSLLIISIITSSDYFLKALLEEKQKEEDIEKMKETISRLVQDATIRTRKEVRGFKLYLKFKILQNFTA